MRRSGPAAACLSLVLMAAALPARAVTIDFRGLTDVPGANGEISGGEFVGQGLKLTLVSGVAFNVGCGTIASCLGADRAAVDDFEGTFRGTFVALGTGDGVSVAGLQIHFCCTTLKPIPTTTRLFDANGALIGLFDDGDVSYSGGTPVAWFETRLGYDAMSTLSYEPQREAVPEPTSLALVLGGLAALRARRTRRG